MPIEIVREPVSLLHIAELAQGTFGQLVKAVVDTEQQLMAIGGELHADEEALLLDLGSSQHALWGINLYPEQYGSPDWIEFDSMTNVRPGQGNRSRSVEEATTRERIATIVERLVRP